MASSTTSTFTLQPWAPTSNEPNTLASILARSHHGHLRNVTEASLQEEIAGEGTLDLDSDSTSTSSSASEDEDADATKREQPVFGKPSTREDLYSMKRYMLEAVNAAKGEVGISLDLVSLIVSKEIPKQAHVTLSQTIKDSVPLGTLGVDFWEQMPVDKPREVQDALLAANVKMDSLQNSADGLLSAAKRLETNVRRETAYWNQILSISSQGWNVCRAPGQQHRLGVSFGFGESAAQFSRKGVAALNPDADGGIHLERGIGSKPKALRAVLKKGGKVVGVSRTPSVPDAEETTLEARIRYARDSLFDEELYHEMIRESRTLASLGVVVEGSAIRMQGTTSDAGDSALEVSLDLISLDQDNSIAEEASDEQSTLAQAILLASRLLLTHAHRDRLRKRSEVPPPLSEKQKDDKPPLPILRPILALLLHRSSLDRFNTYLQTTSAALASAKIEHDVQPASFTLSGNTEVTTSETLLTNTFLRPLTSHATLSLTPLAGDPPTETASLAITLERTLAHSFGPVFTLRATSKEGGDRIHHFQDFSTLASALDATLAAQLAASLLQLVPKTAENAGEWKLRSNEAVLEKDVGVGEQDEALHISFDGLKGEVRVVYTGAKERSQTVRWSADPERKDEMDTVDIPDSADAQEERSLSEVAHSYLNS